jgi:hypothetical protein
MRKRASLTKSQIMRNDLGTSESQVTALGLLQGAFARLGYIFTTLD